MSLPQASPPSRTAQAERNALLALKRLSLEPVEAPAIVAQGKQVVFRIKVRPKPAYGGQPLTDPSSNVAVRIIDPNRSGQRVYEEHSLAWSLADRGARVVAPVHKKVMTGVREDSVGVWNWSGNVKGGRSIQGWATALRSIHEAGEDLNAPPYMALEEDDLRQSDFKSLTAAGRTNWRASVEVVRDFKTAFLSAIREAREASLDLPQSIVHGDWHLNNTCVGDDGVMRAVDFESAGRGPLAVDFSYALMGVRRYGWPKQYLDGFMKAYGNGAPSIADIEPFVRLRELSFVLFPLLNSVDSEDFAREADKRLPIIWDPKAVTEPWQNIGGVAMRPDLLLARSSSRSEIGR